MCKCSLGLCNGRKWRFPKGCEQAERWRPRGIFSNSSGRTAVASCWLFRPVCHDRFWSKLTCKIRDEPHQQAQKLWSKQRNQKRPTSKDHKNRKYPTVLSSTQHMNFFQKKDVASKFIPNGFISNLIPFTNIFHHGHETHDVSSRSTRSQGCCDYGWRSFHHFLGSSRFVFPLI